jgi:hypothetical protein
MPRAKPDRPGAAEAARQNVAEAIARRAGNLTPSERRRLGRWTSATLRDPRLSRELNAARNEAQRALDRSPERKRYWERVSGPLYQSLVAASGDDRRFRLVMLAGHFVALLALVNVPSGLPLPLAVLGVLAAPVSAWLAWGRGTALGDLISDEDAEVLQRSWRSSVESQPPLRPPLAGIISAFAPSTLLVVVLVVIVVANLR